MFVHNVIAMVGMALRVASSQSDGLQEALDAAKNGDLNKARVSARQAATAGSDARSWHVLGVLELALANPKAAEESFSKEIEIGGSAAPTGLEELDQPGSALHNRLQKQKTTVALSAGKAAALNNRAAARYLMGKMSEALEDADAAAVNQADWGVPWANAALILMETNRLQRAEVSAKTALKMGEQTARVFTTLAEIELQTRRFDRVKDDLDEALQRDPSYPYALLAQARLLRQQGKAREAERSFSQALANGPLVVVESRFEDAGGEGFGLAGGATEMHFKLLQHGLPGSKLGYRFLGQTDRQLVEDRSNAYQQTDFGEAAVSGPFGTLYAGHQFSSGGRPGATESIVGVSPQPDARYTFRQTLGAWQYRTSLTDSLSVSFLAGYRSTKVGMRLAPGTPAFNPLQDEQLLGETRFDLEHGGDQVTSLGVALSRTNRTRNGATPIEPLEQVLSAGRTHQITSYALHRRPLVPNVDLILGGVVGGTTSNIRFSPVAALGVKVTPTRTVRLSITPRINDAVSNLMPLDILADPPQNNPIDRKLASADDFNRNPTLQGASSRMLDFELSFGADAEQSGVPQTLLFHRRLNDVNAQAADPRLAPALLLTPVGAGEATGIEERIRFDFSRHFRLRLWGRYQETRATIKTPTFDAAQYPSQVPMASVGMPNFPRFQGSLRFDYVDHGWDLGFEVQHVGRRPRAVTVNGGSGNVTYLSDAPPATGLNLYLTRRAGRNLNLTLGVFNLAKASFYPGYPGGTTALFGYEYKF